MYIVIAKILATDGRSIEACRLFNTSTKEIALLSLKKIKGLVNSGETIVGFKKTQISNYRNGKLSVNVVKERGKFNFSRIPEINGAGELVKKEDADRLTVYGWRGFAEAKKYICVDYEGKDKELTVDEFMQEIKQNRINGVILNPKTGKPNILSLLDIEI